MSVILTVQLVPFPNHRSEFKQGIPRVSNVYLLYPAVHPEKPLK